MLTDAEAITIVREYCETQFPKTCSCCGHVYPTLKDYLLAVTPIGEPTCWGLDQEAPPGELPSADAMAFANCPCGSTLTVSSDGMAWRSQWKLLVWAGYTRFKRRLTTGQLMSEVRAGVDAQVLGEARAPLSARATPREPRTARSST